jgi:hypothetical protein
LNLYRREREEKENPSFYNYINLNPQSRAELREEKITSGVETCDI